MPSSAAIHKRELQKTYENYDHMDHSTNQINVNWGL